jgi:predicted enzyme related to lactoylglutathione lyase
MDRPRVAWGEVTIDCRDPGRVAAFWSALLDAPAKPQTDGWFSLGPLVSGGPTINLQPVPEEKDGKARVHLDIWVDDFNAAITLVKQLGGKRVGEVRTYPESAEIVMADPEGTEFCLVSLSR